MWCDIHGDRAMKDYATSLFKKANEIPLGSSLLHDMQSMLRNIRIVLASAKTYEDLCLVVGFVDKI